MDSVKAKELAAKLLGVTMQKWVIGDLIDHGKSAAVFKARDKKNDQLVALKIFDDELIEKYGDHAQLSRIDRELDLIGKSHPNMVEILGGGIDENTKNHFLVMQFIEGQNLKKTLSKIPVENVPQLVSQLSDCCEYLETLGLVHRDIKPENIIVNENFSHLILLDFGVVRPFGHGDITDEDGIQAFVGTLQYSSPEFLLRLEEDTINGWRALTFYQIGAVMHDLIMRTPIFSDSAQPYARLVNAVQHDTPTIASSSYPSYLVETARICLSKQPNLRVDVLDWSSFHPPKASENSLEELRKRVSLRSFSTITEPSQSGDDTDQTASLIEDVVSHLKLKVRSIRKSNQAAFPPVQVTRSENILSIICGPSIPHSLNGMLCIWFRLDVLDAATGLVEVKATASLSAKDPVCPGNWYVLHKGTASSSNLTTAIELCMYAAMDQAQLNKDKSEILELDFSACEIGD